MQYEPCTHLIIPPICLFFLFFLIFPLLSLTYLLPPSPFISAPSQAKTESWRRHCQEIEKTPECARLHRILSKGGQSASSSIQLKNGEYTTTEKGTLEDLLWVYFPGSEIIPEPS
jgi:invasion protein IalB